MISNTAQNNGYANNQDNGYTIRGYMIYAIYLKVNRVDLARALQCNLKKEVEKAPFQTPSPQVKVKSHIQYGQKKPPTLL